jgi:hypothetical protein
MIKRKADPAQLEGEALERWYLRTPEQLEQERKLSEQEAYNAFYGDLRPAPASETEGQDGAPWQEARGPTLAPAVPVPRAPIAPLPSRATSPEPGKGGFFDGATHYPGSNLYGGLPYPLNEVTALPNSRFWLGDRREVSRDELDRIYLEQQVRMSGGDGSEPQARVVAVDRAPDGRIPNAQDVPKGVRELDLTCHPFGGWEKDVGFASYSPEAQRHEEQITHAPGLDYVVRIPGEGAVKYEGCAVWKPKPPLLEAKGPNYAPLVSRAHRSTFYDRMADKQRKQVERQIRAARGRTVELHAAEPEAVGYFKGFARPPMPVQLTPPR